MLVCMKTDKTPLNFNPFIISAHQNLSYIDRIKLLMMVAMTVGHLAWAFVPTNTLLSEILHFFGRITIPLACFLVVEGYRLTHDVWGYVRRLFGFGLLAQLPFLLNFYTLFGDDGLLANPAQIITYGNVLFSLGFGLLAIIILDKIHHKNLQQKLIYLILIIPLALLSTWSDWSVFVIFWVGAIFYGGTLGFFLITIGLFGLSFLLQDNLSITPYIITLQTQHLMDYGIFTAIPIMLWYQTNKHRSPTSYRLPRLLFYWYYVLHLLIIGLILNVIAL